MEARASFADNLAGKFELISQRIQQEDKNFKVYVGFFQSVQKSLKKLSKGLTKALAPVKQLHQQQSKESLDSWGYALNAVVSGSEGFCAAILNTCKKYTDEVLEPFQLFTDHYEESNKAFIRDCGRVIESLSQQRGKVRKSKEKYTKSVKGVASAADTHEEETVRQRTRSMNEAGDEYSLQIVTLNAYIKEKEAFYRNRLESLQQNEENRIEFLRRHFAKFFGVTETLATEYLRMRAGVQKVLDIVNPMGDLQLFVTVAARGKKADLFEKAAFDSSDESPHRHTSDSGSYSPGTASPISPKGAGEKEPAVELPEEIETYIKNVWTRIVSSQAVEPADKSQFLEIIKAPQCRERLLRLAGKHMRKQHIANPDSFSLMANVVNSMLEQIGKLREPPIHEIATILSMAGLIYSSNPTKGEKPTVYLRERILKQDVWKSREMWETLVRQKLARSLDGIKGSMAEHKDSGIVKKVLDVGAKFFKPKDKELRETEAKEAREETGRRAVVYSDLILFASEMALMKVDPDMCRDLLIQFCLTYKLDSDKLYQLLSDSECARGLERTEKVPSAERRKVFLARQTAKQTKYAFGERALVLRLSLQFLGDLPTLRNVLIMNKLWRDRFRHLVYKQALRAPGLSQGRRAAIWKAILPSRELPVIYQKLKDQGKMRMFQATNKSVEEVIELDIIRSFHVYGDKTQEVRFATSYRI